MVLLSRSTPTPKQIDPPTLALKTIFIKHPAYAGYPIFLRLTAYLVGDVYCFPLRLALDAAAIMANNVSGYFTPVESPQDIVSCTDSAELLPAGQYLFFVHNHNPSSPYALCMSFRAWRVPSRLPAHWLFSYELVKDALSDSQLSEVIRQRDERTSCQQDWWDHNNIDSYILSPATSGVDQAANVITLRADLTDLGMDRGHFVFAPYGVDNQIAAVFMTPELDDLAYRHNLQSVQLPKRIHPYCLFIRFARSVFQTNNDLLERLATQPGLVYIDVSDDLEQHIETRKASEKRRNAESAPGDGGDGARRRMKGKWRPKVDESEATEDEMENESRAFPGLGPNVPNLCRTYGENDYTIWEERERLGDNADVYPGFAAMMRLKNNYLLQNRRPGGARIGGIWDDWVKEEETDEVALSSI
ncbi:HNHc domain-containing protein [Mycena kentingensis (nom. inval.)]|nr:HNHc domain-containing protein [Mycena kentingensis (nom. inval.)]